MNLEDEVCLLDDDIYITILFKIFYKFIMIHLIIF
jgi:hypothetical protein